MATRRRSITALLCCWWWRWCLLLLVVLSNDDNIPVAEAFALQRQQQPPKNVQIVILPGFGNDRADYEWQTPGSLVASLVSRGWERSQIDILPIQRSDWLWQVFGKGLWDASFWLGRATAQSPSFAWYLSRMSRTVQQYEKEDKQVILLAHSAGGWLARACLGYNYSNHSTVIGLVTLGTPHLPPPPHIMDMTRGALKQTHVDFPGCHHAPHVFYITVAGAAVRGERSSERQWLFFWEPTPPTAFAFSSYEAVCGNGTVLGDGVVPIDYSHLEGAVQLTLKNVWHSISMPDQWYGSEKFIDAWHDRLLEEVESAQQQKRTLTRQ